MVNAAKIRNLMFKCVTLFFINVTNDLVLEYLSDDAEVITLLFFAPVSRLPLVLGMIICCVLLF